MSVWDSLMRATGARKDISSSLDTCERRADRYGRFRTRLDIIRCIGDVILSDRTTCANSIHKAILRYSRLSDDDIRIELPNCAIKTG